MAMMSKPSRNRMQLEVVAASLSLEQKVSPSYVLAATMALAPTANALRTMARTRHRSFHRFLMGALSSQA